MPPVMRCTPTGKSRIFTGTLQYQHPAREKSQYLATNQRLPVMQRNKKMQLVTKGNVAIKINPKLTKTSELGDKDTKPVVTTVFHIFKISGRGSRKSNISR